MERDNIVAILTGWRGCGKTSKSRKLLQNVPRVLWVMTTDHPSFRDIRILTDEQLAVWTSDIEGHVRVVSNNPKKTFAAINKHVWNASIVYEDAKKYIPPHLPDDIRNGITDSKQHNNDLYFQFHSLRRVPVEIYEDADYLTMFKSSDAQEDGVKKIPKQAWPVHARVMADTREVVDTYGEGKIGPHLTIELE